MILKKENEHMGNVYSWGSYKFGIDPNIVGSIVEQIEETEGKVTSEKLLDVAKDPDSPIHNMFEWDDTKAAEKYRLSTSAHIINGLRVVVKTSEGEEKKLSAFVSVKVVSKKERTEYINVIDALENKNTRAVVMERMKNDMKSFIGRYELYEEVAGVISAMQEVLNGQTE